MFLWRNMANDPKNIPVTPSYLEHWDLQYLYLATSSQSLLFVLSIMD